MPLPRTQFRTPHLWLPAPRPHGCGACGCLARACWFGLARRAVLHAVPAAAPRHFCARSVLCLCYAVTVLAFLLRVLFCCLRSLPPSVHAARFSCALRAAHAAPLVLPRACRAVLLLPDSACGYRHSFVLVCAAYARHGSAAWFFRGSLVNLPFAGSTFRNTRAGMYAQRAVLRSTCACAFRYLCHYAFCHLPPPCLTFLAFILYFDFILFQWLWDRD